MRAEEIRKTFLEFFREKGHRIEPPSPLSIDDPQLLFTIAGMVPFKPFFLGEKKSPFPRICTCQPCFRTTDLEKVGESSYHHTFFEMLGNFSFGDYFKEEVCEWAWELLTQRFSLPPDRLWITTFREDEETFKIWRRMGIPEKKIIRKGGEENFWQVGTVGPCGPDTEIFFDWGKNRGCKKPGCKPGCDCGRWVELWNLVFMQFYREKDGSLSSLPSKNIDTGMGLERIASVLQGVEDDFHTDLFLPLLSWLESLVPQPQPKALRIVSDHLRGLVFLLGEGVIPSNLGKGYVVRRLIRRGYRFGRRMGLEGPFLYRGVEKVIEIMGRAYPFLEKEKGRIKNWIKLEEENFDSTLSRGMELVEKTLKELKERKEKIFLPQKMFTLYDTYGFPPELLEEICEEEGIKVDREGYELLLAKQREKGRKSFERKRRKEKIPSFNLPQTPFVGYTSLKEKAKILALFKEGEKSLSLKEGEEGEVILSLTPFYPEGGGQVGDRGRFIFPGGKAVVLDTQKEKEIIFHLVKVEKGEIKKGEEVLAEVDQRRRKEIARAHTATHLLQAALREVLGTHLRQYGSLVEEERLRFDFTHPSPLKEEEKKKVEKLVNEKILENLKVRRKETTLREARKEGAIALFEEIYKERVRMVKIGEFSYEVCGGTHLDFSGEVGVFVIESETGVAAGVRRIEALVGKKAFDWLREKKELLEKVSRTLEISPSLVDKRAEELKNKLRELERGRERILKILLEKDMERLLKESRSIRGIKVVKGLWENVPLPLLRELAEKAREKIERGIVLLASLEGEKVLLVCTSTHPEYPANQILKKLTQISGGGGGGRWDFAQGGSPSGAKLKEALDRLEEEI